MKNPILLVEDDVVFSKMLSRFLERNGYDVIGCYTLEEAQKSFNEKNYLDSLYLDGNRNYYETHYYIEKVDYDEDGEEVDWESELQELNEEQEKAYDFVREHFRNNLHKIMEKEEE